MLFSLKSDYQPTGDQPQAISKLIAGIKAQKAHQTLLGVTGSGKTFTIANVIASVQKPTLVISHNKTLAAQLYQEFRDFFPDNAVSYFVSYYDYYQPEAYMPQTDTYIAKETNINDEIDKLRLSATANLLTRPDTIIIASVSCIYNLGSPVEYGQNILELIEGQLIDRQTILSRLSDLQYQRNDTQIVRGTYLPKGDIILVWPAYLDYCLKLEMLDKQLVSITRVHPVTLVAQKEQSFNNRETIYPAKHYLTNPLTQKSSIEQIKEDLQKRLKQFKDKGQVVEAFRLEQKVTYDLEMLETLGYVNGVENYSRYFDGREEGDPPYSLLDYFKLASKKFSTNGFLTVVDESHITLPQIRGMYAGDRSRKQTLIDYGFRLPSALDNRPLKFPEFLRRVPQLIYTSATPNDWELTQSGTPVEQLVRPTGLLDPQIEIRPTQGQVQDIITEVMLRVKNRQRVLITTLTKKMAEALTEYLNEPQNQKDTPLKVQYLHSDVETLDRNDILSDLRKGEYDVVVGINLLREGLDLPEVSLVVIMDADKEGFLRSKTSLIQTMGRAARHLDGRVIMYADKQTPSMKSAIDEVNRRRKIQQKFNQKHGITPTSINKPIRLELLSREVQEALAPLPLDGLTPEDKQKLQKTIKKQMLAAAKTMDFELAASLRDQLADIQKAL